ncbi:hypothetical protein [Rufibacter roseus]|uniref:Secreted protein n=1 Tax=Rufibacter roseus TaxID=1567108 RepID=A0ABW2DGP2_9BACT|nr:hypothetical protein [Rufibacter roseus]
MRCSIATAATTKLNLYLVLPLSASAPTASALPAPAGDDKEEITTHYFIADSRLADSRLVTQDSELKTSPRPSSVLQTC